MKIVKEKIMFYTLLSLPLLEGAQAAMTAKDVIDYAKTAAGSRYKMGHSQWDPNDRSFGYTDCAGLVLKAWQWPKKIPYREVLKDSYSINGSRVPGKLYTGSMFEVKRHKLPWSVTKDFDNAQLADAYTYNDGKQGHTFLVTRYDENNNIKSIEARNPEYGVGYFTRTKAYIKAAGYSLMRNKQIARNGGSSTTNSKPERKPTQYEPVLHTVVKGDTLSALSRKHKVPVEHIVSLNPGKIKNYVIRIGDQIQIK
ncbi:MAG: LysM peptidoglycan-binding domain-containing protein [Bdellovibrionota bacterium]